MVYTHVIEFKICRIKSPVQMRCCWNQVNEKNELLIDRSIGSLYTTTTMFNCTFRFYLSRFSTHITLVFVKGNSYRL
jgi:hypothetical protein